MQGIGAQSVANPRVRRDVARVRSAGRFGDTQLAHLSPRSDAMLKSMGGAGTRNPQTGLKEHFSFKDALSFLAPVALNFVAPGVGTGIGEALGLSGTAASVIGSALAGGGIGALTGGGQGALTGALTGGALAGFNEAGGFKGIGDALGIGGGAGGSPGEAAMPDASGQDMLHTEVQPNLEGVSPVAEPPPPPALAQLAAAPLPSPPEMAPRGEMSNVGESASTRGAGGVPTGTTLDKYKAPLLIGGGLLALGALGKPQAPAETGELVREPASFGGPLPQYELDRGAYAMPTDEELQMFGRAGRPASQGTGIFYEAPNRYKRLADGGKVAPDEKWNPYEKYDKFRKPGAWRGDEVVPNAKPPSAVRKAAERLSEKGRNGDTILAHINPEEADILKRLGGSGTTNPHTGLLEFGYGSDTEGGADQGVGGDTSQGATEAGSAANAGGTPSVDNTPAGGRDEGERGRDASRAGGIGAFPDSRTLMDRISDRVSTKFNDIKANPITYGINALASLTPIGMLNTLSGIFGGPTVGSMATAAGRSIGQAMGIGENSPAATDVAAATNPGAPTGPEIGERSSGDGSFYIPSPTQGVAMAAAPEASSGGPSIAPTWQRNLHIPTDAELRMFGQGGQQQTAGGSFYDTPNMRYMADGGEVPDGRADDVPAMLSHGEHVLDSELVSLAGNGSNEAGHAKIEKWKADIRKRKGKALAKGKISPNAKLPKVA